MSRPKADENPHGLCPILYDTPVKVDRFALHLNGACNHRKNFDDDAVGIAAALRDFNLRY